MKSPCTYFDKATLVDRFNAILKIRRDHTVVSADPIITKKLVALNRYLTGVITPEITQDILQLLFECEIDALTLCCN